MGCMGRGTSHHARTFPHYRPTTAHTWQAAVAGGMLRNEELGDLLTATALTFLLSDNACFMWREYKTHDNGHLRTSITMQDFDVLQFDGTTLVSLLCNKFVVK